MERIPITNATMTIKWTINSKRFILREAPFGRKKCVTLLETTIQLTKIMIKMAVPKMSSNKLFIFIYIE